MKLKPAPDSFMTRKTLSEKKSKRIFIETDLCQLCDKEKPIKRLRVYRKMNICYDCIKDIAKFYKSKK